MASWGLSKYIKTKLIFLPHFLHNFWRKIFLLLYSVNWQQISLWDIGQICEILGRYWADMWDIGQILGRYVRYWAVIGQMCDILSRYWADMWDIGQLLDRYVIYWADICEVFHCEILGNMCIASVCKQGCDVMNFKVNLIFLIKSFFLYDQKVVART